LPEVVAITYIPILSKGCVHITVLLCVQNNTAALLNGVAVMHIL